MHDVAILHDVVLALDTHLASFTDCGLRTVAYIVIVLDDLCADETLLKVGVDDTSALRSFPTATEGPSLHLHLAGGDEGLQTQQRVDGIDEAVTAALAEPHILQEHLLLLVAFVASRTAST